jgi:photosystem II stability/assembly factor-like uncharacterized protein
MAAFALGLALVLAPALTPTHVAFADPRHAVAGGGWLGPFGSLQVSRDGGRSWRLVRLTRWPVVGVGGSPDLEWAELHGGTVYVSRDRGRTWTRGRRPRVTVRPTPCPRGVTANPADEAVAAGNAEWALCASEPGAGNQGKAVFRRTRGRWTRIAFTDIGAPAGRDGLQSAGYATGISMNRGGFGLITSDRGPLQVTRDGGYHWHPLTSGVYDAQPSAGVLPDGFGYVLFATSGISGQRSLEVTSDGGLTWRVVHRWG